MTTPELFERLIESGEVEVPLRSSRSDGVVAGHYSETVTLKINSGGQRLKLGQRINFGGLRGAKIALVDREGSILDEETGEIDHSSTPATRCRALFCIPTRRVQAPEHAVLLQELMLAAGNRIKTVRVHQQESFLFLDVELDVEGATWRGAPMSLSLWLTFATGLSAFSPAAIWTDADGAPVRTALGAYEPAQTFGDRPGPGPSMLHRVVTGEPHPGEFPWMPTGTQLSQILSHLLDRGCPVGGELYQGHEAILGWARAHNSRSYEDVLGATGRLVEHAFGDPTDRFRLGPALDKAAECVRVTAGTDWLDRARREAFLLARNRVQHPPPVLPEGWTHAQLLDLASGLMELTVLHLARSCNCPHISRPR